MVARLLNGVQYIKLMNNNSFKSKSLEDNVYFTLRDIWLNTLIIDYCFEANHFNGILTDEVCYEDRKEDFKYTNVLYDHNSDYLRKLYEWLSKIDGRSDNRKHKKIIYYKLALFEFESIYEDENEYINMNEYIKADDWWYHLIDLINKIEALLEKHKAWKEGNMQ